MTYNLNVFPGVQQIQQMNQQPMVGVQQQPMNMLGVQQQPMNMVGVQQQPMNMVSVQQQPMVGVQQQPMVGVQQQPMVGVQLMNQGMNIQGSQILNQGGLFKVNHQLMYNVKLYQVLRQKFVDARLSIVQFLFQTSFGFLD